MIWQNHLGAIADEQIPIHLHAGVAQSANLIQKCQRIENYTIADHSAAVFAQHAAGHELQNKFFAVDDDRVSGIMPAGVARDHGKVIREHVHDLALALVAPLRADDDRRLGFQI